MMKINQQRDVDIFNARVAGNTWRVLGEQFKLSPERCRQIYLRHLRRSDPDGYREWCVKSSQRSEKYKERECARWRRYEILLRIFDREENPEVVAVELEWSMEQMNKFIAAARADRWVTTTEYNQRMKDLERKYGPLI